MKYTKVTQKPYCCVGACLEMILRRLNMDTYDQEEIASDLGLVVPPEYASSFPHAMIGTKPTAGYGTQIQNPKFSINNFFRKHNIDLKESYCFTTDFAIASKILQDVNDKDIMIICHCGTLYDNPEADWGHAVLLDHYDKNGDWSQVVIQENSEKRNLETVGLHKLLQAIAVYGESNGAGFYIIERTLKKSPTSTKRNQLQTDFAGQVLKFLTTIPRGRVVTYAQIAAAIGRPRATRAVGNILHRNLDGEKYPCYKVVNSQGKLACHYAFGGIAGQRRRLEADGVVVKNGRVDLAIYQMLQ